MVSTLRRPSVAAAELSMCSTFVVAFTLVVVGSAYVRYIESDANAKSAMPPSTVDGDGAGALATS